jgi:hypothetical protein
MLASALPMVPGTGPIDRKLGKLVGLNVFQILLDASFHSPENAHSLSIRASLRPFPTLTVFCNPRCRT